MPFGIQVRTSTGMVDLADTQSGRMVEIIEANSVSGSVTIPGFNATDANFYVVNNSDRFFVPIIAWNNTTKVLSWSRRTSPTDASTSSNFTIYALEV